MNWSNRFFDCMRQICEVVLPAMGTLYFALCKIWGLPWGTEIVGTISAISVFIGTVIGVKRAMYNAVDESELAKLEEEEEGEE